MRPGSEVTTLRIAIIDDEARMRARLREMLHALSPEFALSMEILLFSSGDGWIRFLQEQNAARGSHALFDLVFLDIEMEGKSGIEVGQYIRQELHDDQLQLVYISAHTQYSLALHRFHPLHFLIKEITPDDLREVLGAYCNMRRDERQLFRYKVGRDVLQLEVGQIRYLKANNREITVYLEGSDNAPFKESPAHKLSGCPPLVPRQPCLHPTIPV